ncbi:unnamed protein product [Rotaria sp. Silwood2]|nr:unnamed protein product [Rotaria sp. Silwood2]CAF2832675.1 unnamed protein product [Rotaria sp. Silwood2]CAF4546634.1 unnamed protein product [Rotaria sp. Silwood2]
MLFCKKICEKQVCVEIIENTCPDIFYVPNISLLFGHIYLAQTKNESLSLAYGGIESPYLYYKNFRYDKYFAHHPKILFDNGTCFSPKELLSLMILAYSWKLKYYMPLYNLCRELKGYNWCEDEYLNFQYVRKNISFQTICYGFTELLPITVEERDETECEQWSCNNIYTRCDGLWNCPHGEDEIGCNLSSILNCSSDQHICVSPHTNQLICLPMKKANYDKIDCLGATDEPTLCQERQYETKQQMKFFSLDIMNTSVENQRNNMKNSIFSSNSIIKMSPKHEAHYHRGLDLRV